MTEKTSRRQSSPRRRRRRARALPGVSIPDLGTTCRSLRDERGLTRDQAAHELGYSAVHIGRVERRKQDPTSSFMEAIISGYRLDQTMAAHLHDLNTPAIPLPPPTQFRDYVRDDPTLAMNLARFQTRGALAAYVDPFWNVLVRNDLFARTLGGLDNTESIAMWLFSDDSTPTLLDPESERSWAVKILKGALARHRTSVQADDLVAGLASNREAQRLWSTSVSVSRGRDSRALLHALDADQNPTSYQLTLTESILAHSIQLVVATPLPYAETDLD